MYHIVYLTRNLKNGKIYVGVHSAWAPSDDYLGSGTSLKNAIEKYGHENFERITLHECLTQEDAYECETQIVDSAFVKRRDTYNNKIGGRGYRLGNPTRGGWNKGLKMSSETRKKISDAHKGLPGPRKGIAVSDETRQRMSEKAKARKGRFHHTEETIQKIRESNTGKERSPETRKKMSESALRRNSH